MHARYCTVSHVLCAVRDTVELHSLTQSRPDATVHGFDVQYKHTRNWTAYVQSHHPECRAEPSRASPVKTRP